AGHAAPAVLAQPFLIADNGHSYYVNDGSTAGDVFTTSKGDNLNSGKSPDRPMATLAALLSAYLFQPGDTIYVDAGNYTLYRDIVLTAENNGVRIIGASASLTTLDRNNTNFQMNAFDLQGAVNLTLSQLGVTGGYNGILAGYSAGS